jgi:hypothetical protein
MYQETDNILLITKSDWLEAGLTDNMLKKDSAQGLLKIARRGINGNTQIDVRSIKRPDRLKAIEAILGKVQADRKENIFDQELKPDTEARIYYMRFETSEGLPLSAEKIEEYTNQASILTAILNGMKRQVATLAKHGKRLKMGEFWQLAVDWYLEKLETYPCPAIGNARHLERVFKKLFNGNEIHYGSLIHGNQGNDAARKVSASLEKLLVAIWRTNDKPFINVVHERYLEFVTGSRIIFDKETGEQFNPDDFRHKDRAMEVSVATVWNYLKDIVNETTIYADRNGNFDYMNKMRPKQKRKLGNFSLSKISMDDVVLSRKSNKGWIAKYIAVDVLSGYWFRPAYVIGKPDIGNVYECFRNMFIELSELGLPQPGELEIEHHLMKHIDWLPDVFPYVRFAKSATDKRAEHAIRAFKYGVSKKEGHTHGRWYAKHEAYRVVRNKVDGDFVEPEYQPQAIVADDLSDIEKHNNQLHPLQKTYPGMTRRDVMIRNFNPDLKQIDKWYLYRYIGNETETSIYNNDYCKVQQMDFWLKDYNSLNRLKPNNREVTAYWLPEADGSIKTVYLYQGETYIGEAYNSNEFKYNEFAIERTGEDDANMLHQDKRNAKFDKMIRDNRAELPVVGYETQTQLTEREEITPEIIENTQPKNYDGYDDLDENEDWAAKAINSL